MADYVFVIYLICLDYVTNSIRLNEYINHYEPFPYTYVQVQEIQDIEFKFRAFGYNFNITLHIGSQVIDANTKFTAHGLTLSKRTSVSEVSRHLVTGRVEDIAESTVHGYVFNGVFVGVVNLPKETYYIEPARDFFLMEDVSFETIIYRLSDVNISAYVCGSRSNCNNFKFKNPHMGQPLRQRFARYLQKLNQEQNNLVANESKEDTRSHRSSRQFTRNICTLRVMVDHVLYQRLELHTINSIIAEIMVILNQVDAIYRATDFDNNGAPEGIGFRIVEFIIWWNKEIPGYKHGADKYTADEYLERIAHYKTRDVCLVITFTARDFDSILGVAYIRAESFAGGICSGRSGYIYMNVGMITLFPRGKRMSNAVAALVTGHEIGHAFGSNHDPEECLNSPDGDYIMKDTVTTMLSPNCQKFSSCSRLQINELFHRLGTSCFVAESTYKTCGNGIIDADTEECDCSTQRSCKAIDPCCIPKGGEEECKYNRKEGAVCSFKHDACCTSQCQISPANNLSMCNPSEYCKMPSYCNGVSKDCPVTGAKPDNSECLGGFGVCIRGKCESVACHKDGKVACTTFKQEQACFLACMKDGWCMPASTLGIVHLDKTRIRLPDGVRCWDGRGYCDQGRCHVVTLNSSIPPPGEYSPYHDEPHDNFEYESVLIMALYLSLALIYVAYCVVCSGYISQEYY